MFTTFRFTLPITARSTRSSSSPFIVIYFASRMFISFHTWQFVVLRLPHSSKPGSKFTNATNLSHHNVDCCNLTRTRLTSRNTWLFSHFLRTLLVFLF